MVVAAPAFADANGGGIGLGDAATIRLSCQFELATPILPSTLGNAVAVGIQRRHPIQGGDEVARAPLATEPESRWTRDDGTTDGRGIVAHRQDMARQIALPILWFFAAWSAASMIAFALGLNDAIVPLVAIGSAAVAYGQGASRRAAIHRPATSVAGQSTFVAGQ